MKKRGIALITLIMLFTMAFTMLTVNAQEQITVLLNGELLEFDVPPCVENNRTLVPLRAIFEALGADVKWDGKTQTVTATTDSTTVKLKLGSKDALVNGDLVVLDTCATVKDNRMLVPARFVSEALGADVGWDNANKRVLISKPDLIVMGNTAGNLSNYNGIVEDDDYIYVSSKNGPIIKQSKRDASQTIISNDGAISMNASGEWIYCILYDATTQKAVEGIHRIKKDGTKTEKLNEDLCFDITVRGEWVYYINSSEDLSLYKMKKDGSNQQLVDFGKGVGISNVYNYTIKDNDVIFISSDYEGKIVKGNLNGTGISNIIESYSYFVIPSDTDEWIYYTEFIEERAVLNRVKLDGTMKKLITDQASGSFIVVDDWIYYIDSNDDDSTRTLYRIKTDGTEKNKLLEDEGLASVSFADGKLFYCTLKIGSGSVYYNIYQYDEAESKQIFPLYNPAKEILEKSISKMSELKKYKITYNEIMGSSTKATLLQSVDKSAKVISEISTETNKDNSTGSEVWIQNDTMYEKTQVQKDWSIYKYSNEKVEDLYAQLQYVSLGLDWIQNMKLSDKSTNEAWVLAGYMSDVSELSILNVLPEQLESARNKFYLELTINKETYYCEKAEVIINDKVNVDKIQYKLTVEYSEHNGSFNLVVPSHVLQAKSRFQQAEVYEKRAGEAFVKGEYENCIAESNSAINIYSNSVSAYMFKALSLKNLSKPEEAINVYDELLTLYPFDYSIYPYQAECYIDIYEYEKAKELCLYSLELNPEYYLAHNNLGLVYVYTGEYDEAIKNFDLAISEDPEYEIAYRNKVYTLYAQKNYLGCIEFANEVEEKFGESFKTLLYKAYSYEAKNSYEEAIEQYKLLLEETEDDKVVYTNIGWDYYSLENYKMATEYAQKAIAIDSEDNSALTLLYYIEYQETTSEAKKLAEFVRSNYLYKADIEGFDEKCDEFAKKGNKVSLSDVKSFINSIKKEDDQFTYIISGEDYQTMQKQDNTESFYAGTLYYNNKSYEDIHYVRFDIFDTSAGLSFNEYIHSIENTEDKSLIIDLRSNPGGLGSVANGMLDLLLPERGTSYFIDRNGEIETYSSDSYCKTFKHIYILVDEYSASCSELLTLSLKKFLKNVTVIGKPTYGKGVGQYAYEDKTNGYFLFLVSHYWNVVEQNINNSAIQPDIIVEDTEKCIDKVLENY